MRLLLVVAIVAAARPAPKKAAPPPRPPAAEDPGGGAPALEPPGPPVTGHTSGIELEALSRRTTTFRFEVDTAALAIEADTAARLERHLAADPRWRLVERDGARIAIERERVGETWQLGPHGYHVADDRCHRVALRLDPRDPTSAWAESGQITRIGAGSSELALVVFATGREPCGAQAATAVIVEGPTLALEVFESDDGRDRPITLDALAGAIELMHHVAVAPDAVDRDGYDRFSIASGEPVALAEPTVELSAAGPGLLAWSARLNPGARGWAWLRLLDGALAPWEVEAVGRGTRERPGWSGDESKLFHVGGTFAVPSGPAFSGTAELWFAPDGGRPVLVTALPIDVPER